MKNQSECVKVEVCLFKIISNYEIMSNVVSMSNEEFSRSNQCGSNQNIFESSACDSHSDTYSLLDDLRNFSLVQRIKKKLFVYK